MCGLERDPRLTRLYHSLASRSALAAALAAQSAAKTDGAARGRPLGHLREAGLTDAQRSKRFVEKSREVLGQSLRMDKKAQVETLRLVAGLREDLTDTLRSADLTDFGRFNLRQVKDNIDRAVQDFSERYAIDLDRFEGQAWGFGRKILDDPFEAAGIEVRLPAIPQGQLEVFRAAGADLVKGVGDEVRNAMTRQLTLVQTGAVSPSAAMKNIRNLLATTPRAADGRFGGIAERARAIVRTELKTVQEMAAEVRRQQWVDAGVEELQKEWNGCVSRIGHLALNGKRVKTEERYPLMGQNGTMYRPRFPRDRDVLPVEEVVNCAGFTMPFKESWKEFREAA